MPRTTIWKSIADTIEAEIAQGHYAPGTRLPTEAELSTRFGVNRHTVRHALQDMAERGIVRSRRGSGVFVETPPTDYPIGRRVRFHRNILASGRMPEKRVLRLEQRAANPAEARALNLASGDPVLAYEGLSLAGGTPVAHFVSVFPGARLPGLADALAEVASVTEALRRCGIPDYIRRDTRITAVRASATQALHLHLSEGDPLIRTTGINTTPDGIPVELGNTWFAGDRVTLTFAQE